jgi:hypothetical protein
MTALEARQGEESFSTAAIADLATMSTLAEFDSWWLPRAERINRLSVDAPRLWHQVSYAIEAMHKRRRSRGWHTS